MGEPITPYKGREIEPIVQAALKLYDEGVEIEESAKELGVPARTIHRWLASNAPEAWKAAQQGRAQADYEQVRKRRDEARKVLEGLELEFGPSTDANDIASVHGISAAQGRVANWRLAHAREVLAAADQELKHQEWLLERLIRKLYGQDVPAHQAQAVQINITLGAGKNAPEVAQVIDVKAERD